MDFAPEESLAQFQRKLNISPNATQYLEQLKARQCGEVVKIVPGEPEITQIDQFTVKINNIIIRDWENDLRASTAVAAPLTIKKSSLKGTKDENEDFPEPEMESIVDASEPTLSLMSVLGIGKTERESTLQVDNYVEQEEEDDCGYFPTGAGADYTLTGAPATVTDIPLTGDMNDGEDDAMPHTPIVLSNETINLLLAGKFAEQQHCAEENGVVPFENDC